MAEVSITKYKSLSLLPFAKKELGFPIKYPPPIWYSWSLDFFFKNLIQVDIDTWYFVTKSEFLLKNYLKYFVETVSEMLAMILGLKGGNRL